MTGTIFTGYIFPKYKSEEVMRPRMEGIADPALKEFLLLDTSVLAKEEFKEECFEKEFIKSFLNAAESLAADGQKNINGPGMYVLSGYSYALPVLFLTRHCMELALKRALRRAGKISDNTHDLGKLWNSLLSEFPKQKGREDRRAVRNMGLFVKAITQLDSTGFSLRYSKDKQGQFTQNRPLFINDKELTSYLKKFVDQLEQINFDNTL